MPIITDKRKALDTVACMRSKKAVLAVFCTASHWNTEAILLACQKYARKHALDYIPVSIGITFNYPHMPQAQRVTASGDPKAGFLSIIKHMDALCGTPKSPYSGVTVLPHLNHAHPERDRWALIDGLPWLASVMFDAQTYPYERNVEMTTDYVRSYGKLLLVEGACDTLSMNDSKNRQDVTENRYVEHAISYVSATGVDLLVADLGTEQQSGSTGGCFYLQERARKLTAALEIPMLVLHGTSCLDDSQMLSLGSDGIVRANIWTRIVREAGIFAANRLVGRMDGIRSGDFESCDARAFIQDLTIKAAEIMEGMLDALGYQNLKGI
jgi:fructose/tagatose bisphosphate aldolase